MKPEDAEREADEGKLRPVYVLGGEETFLRDRVLRSLRKASLGNGLADFNEDKFVASETSIDRVLSAVRTVPMMAPRRWVLVRGIDRWESSGEGRSPLDELADYAEKPIPTTCLVLSADKLDGRRRLAALAKKGGFLVTCDALSERELPGWIVKRAKDLGHALSSGDAEFLAELVGPELSFVNDALERLSLYVGEGKPIREDAISATITRVRADDTWAVVDAVGTKDLAAAFRALQDAYDPRDRGLPLLGALAWSIRQLARVVAAQSLGLSPEAAAKRAGVPPFRARDVAAKAKNVSVEQSEKWMKVLARTDLELKRSRRAPEAILEEMLTELC